MKTYYTNPLDHKIKTAYYITFDEDAEHEKHSAGMALWQTA